MYAPKATKDTEPRRVVRSVEEEQILTELARNIMVGQKLKNMLLKLIAAVAGIAAAAYYVASTWKVWHGGQP